ncbi:hypothetical protein BH24ACT7_BH24ACT7_06110 [soil metagenome]
MERAFGQRWNRQRFRNAGRRIGGRPKVGIRQIHAEPVPAEAGGHPRRDTGTDERVEHQSRARAGSAAAGGLAVRLKGLPTGGANHARTAGADRRLDQALREGGGMVTAVGRLGQPPDVIRVLAERMARSPFPAQRRQAVVGAAVAAGPDGGLPRLARAGVGYADGVEIEPVARLRAGEQVDLLPRAGETIGGRVRHRIGLGPDALVAHQPAAPRQRQCQSLRSEQQALAPGAMTAVAGVGVGHVQPDSAGRLQDAFDPGEDVEQVGNPVVDGGLVTDLPGLSVVAELVVRRGGHYTVDADRIEERQLQRRLAQQQPVPHLRRWDRRHGRLLPGSPLPRSRWPDHGPGPRCRDGHSPEPSPARGHR